MSKKNFKGGLNSLLGDNLPPKKKELTTETAKEFLVELNKATKGKPKRGRPVTQTKEINKISQKGTNEGETRATFILNEELLEKLKAIAYWERVLIKDVVNKALQEAISKHEKKSGDIKPIPKKIVA